MKMDWKKLSKLVGRMSALMLFGQQGACIGKTFKLANIKTGTKVEVQMVVIDGDLTAVVRDIQAQV